jgi:hypothetical protein
MKIISHRANLHGRNPALENNPNHIRRLLDKFNFDVEIDVWREKNKDHEWSYQLGHDEPRYKVKEDLLIDPRVWCHAKNYAAFFTLIKLRANVFMHDKDQCALTSKGYFWTADYHGLASNVGPIGSEKLVLMYQNRWDVIKNHERFYAICTDYPICNIEDYLLES